MTPYTGTALQTAQDGLELYLPSDELVRAVNLAMHLKRPLLLMGEPGCGKTRLAEALAYELHKDVEDWQEKHYFTWHIKSTSRAQDGIYQIDHLRRLHDANSKMDADLNITKYIKYGAFCDAFTKPQNGGKPNVLLIDEIDKGDIDFANDLLLELDKKEKKFFIQEFEKEQQWVAAESNVIVIITSNRERELPPAFLRRCLFHYIDFPTTEKLKEIIQKKYVGDKGADISKAVTLFQRVRDEIEGLNKKPSTSELLEWYEVLHQCRKWKKEGNLDPQRQQIVDELRHLGTANIPFREVLLKDFDSFLNLQISPDDDTK